MDVYIGMFCFVHKSFLNNSQRSGFFWSLLNSELIFLETFQSNFTTSFLLSNIRSPFGYTGNHFSFFNVILHLSCKVISTPNCICCLIFLSRSITVSFCNILQSDLDFIILSNFISSAIVTSIFLPFPDHLQICWKPRSQNKVLRDSKDKLPPRWQMIPHPYFYFCFLSFFYSYLLSILWYIPWWSHFFNDSKHLAQDFVERVMAIWTETTTQIRDIVTDSFK